MKDFVCIADVYIGSIFVGTENIAGLELKIREYARKRNLRVSNLINRKITFDEEGELITVDWDKLNKDIQKLEDNPVFKAMYPILGIIPHSYLAWDSYQRSLLKDYVSKKHGQLYYKIREIMI